MIFFAYAEGGAPGMGLMHLLKATAPEDAMAEADDRLRSLPGIQALHVFDGDQFVGTSEGPEFGFAGLNNTSQTGSMAKGPVSAPTVAGNA